MSLHRDQKKSQIPWLDLGIFALVLAFLGYSTHTFLQSRARPPAVSPPPIAPPMDAPPASARSPASQKSEPGGSTEVVKVPCLGLENKELQSGARLIEIQSPLCGTLSRLPKEGWTAVNESSGEEILVFVNPKEKTLSTSYFTLKDGSNLLLFAQEIGRAHV